MSTVLIDKDTATPARQPLLLAELQFLDGSILYASTAPLNPGEGGYGYNGNNYFARIDSGDIGQIAARSEQGIDRIPSVQLRLLDSDKTLVTTYEFATGKGFRGATLTLRLTFWQADTANFSTDSWTPFVGIVSDYRYERQGRGDVLVLTANASHNLARTYLPIFHSQQRCSNIMPRNQAERISGAGDLSSKNFGCGYCPDVSVTDPETGGSAMVGNTSTPNQTLADGTKVTDANGIYIWCPLTRQGCMERMGNGTNLDTDSQGRQSGRFTGITWAPDKREYLSKSYIQGKTIPVVQVGPEGSYNRPFPMVRGTQWVRPVVLSLPADANSTRMEIALCQDKLSQLDPAHPSTTHDAVLQVVINGVIVPKNGSSPDNNLFRWNWSSNGSRRGLSTGDVPWSHKGDPHGSIATIEAVVYDQIASSGSIPDVRVLLEGTQVKTPTSAEPTAQASWPLLNTKNPVWLWLDTAIWGNYKYSEMDLQTFINEAPFCDITIPYTNLSGNRTSTNVDGSPHRRFECQFALEQRRSGQDILQAILRSCNAQATRNLQTGKVQFLIRKGLAEQQPSPVSGSNYSVAISSLKADGSLGTGYFAYAFDETNILRSGPDDPPFLKIYTAANAQTPNKITFPFQDQDNSYAEDSLSVVDPDAIDRAGGVLGDQEIVDQWNVLGVSNFDQGIRVANTALAEQLRGNPAGDTRGTIYCDIPADFRCLHLGLGSIVCVSWMAYGWIRQPFRVIRIAPGSNWETCTVTVAWHNDLWYTDVFGQTGAPQSTDPRSHKPNRLPYPWQPYGVQPVTNDSLFWSQNGYDDGSWWGMGVAQKYEPRQDGTSIAKVEVSGCPPVNTFTTSTQPPLVGIRGTALATGGAILSGKEWYGAIAAMSGGVQTALSTIFKVVTPGLAGSDPDTCTITTPQISWFAGTDAWRIYLGTDPNNLSNQGQGTGTPSTITLSGLNFETYGPPDQLANYLNFQAKRCGAATEDEGHAGVWGDKCATVTTNGLKFNPPYRPFGVNQWAGYDLLLVANPQGDTTPIPIAAFRVTANDAAGNMTVTPDPLAAGIQAGSVFVAMSVPGAGSTTTSIVDANWDNAYNTTGGMVPGAVIGDELRIVLGTGQYAVRTITANTATSVSWDDPLPQIPDSTTRYIICSSIWDKDVDTETIIASNGTPNPVPTVAKVPLDNYKGQTVFLVANVSDVDGNVSLTPFAPWRLVYIWGASGGLTQSEVTITAADSPYTMDGSAQFLHVDTSGGNVIINCNPAATLPLDKYYIDKATDDGNTVTINAASGEQFPENGGSNSITLTAQNGNAGGLYGFAPKH